MGRWTGETLTVQFGAKWTYKLRLEEQTETGTRSNLVLGAKAFDTQQEAISAGDAHLKEEIAKRSSQTALG